MTRLRVADVSVALGGRTVLREVDAAFDDGGVVGLLGPNGAGKTTFIRAVLGLVPLTGGSIDVDGAPPRRARDTFGYVPQNHAFAWDFPLSIEGAVRTGLHRTQPRFRPLARRDRERVAAALERVGLAELAARPIGELSGGQRQRVLVARALVSDPRVLLLDEPFTGVDAPTQQILSEVLGELARGGRVIIMSTHDLTHARSRCDRLILLNGTVVADGPAEGFTDAAALLSAFAGGPV